MKMLIQNIIFFEKRNKILKLKSNDILAVVKIGKNMEEILPRKILTKK